MLWPLKPYPDDILPEKIVATAVRTNQIYPARLIAARLLFRGYELTDSILKSLERAEDSEYYNSSALSRLIKRCYIPNDPIAILELAASMCRSNDHLYQTTNATEDTITLVLDYSDWYRKIEVPKNLITDALKKNTFKTLSLFCPETRHTVIDLFSHGSTAYRHRTGKNKDFCRFLVSQGLRINPKSTLKALSMAESMTLDMNTIMGIFEDLDINDTDDSETMELVRRAYNNYYRSDLDQYEF